MTSSGIFQNLIELILEFAPEELQKLVREAPGNQQYRSKTVQDEAIQVFASYIKQVVVDEIKKTRFYSVLGDEANDISNKEQMALVLRYVNENDEICESFVGFLHCKEGTSGEALAILVEDAVKDLGKKISITCYL